MTAFSSKARSTRKIRCFFKLSNAYFSCDRTVLSYSIFGFSALTVGLRQILCVVVSQLYSNSPIISALICFFRFFRANLLSAIKLVGWVRWRAWCLSTPNQSGRKVQKFQHEALCKGMIINKLTLKSLQKPS